MELGGLSQPVISQKKIVHDIRMREGEVNLLGGLLASRTPEPYRASLAGGHPGAWPIFRSGACRAARGELLIALIPHVVRAPFYSESNLRGVSAGNDQNVKLNYAPVLPAPATPHSSDGRTRAGSGPGTPAPATPAPATPAPTTPTPTTPAPATPQPPAEQPPTTPAPGQPPVPPAAAAACSRCRPRLIFTPATAQAQLNSPIGIQLMLENVTDLFSAPVKIKFDPKVLRLTSIRPGAVMSGDGRRSTSARTP